MKTRRAQVGSRWEQAGPGKAASVCFSLLSKYQGSSVYLEAGAVKIILSANT